jgi:trimethylamine--corrinoid protein Co-methyltransferase
MARPSFSLLSPQEVEKLRTETIIILSELGVEINHHRARELLRGAGARVDLKTQKVFIPPELSEKCLRLFPRQFIWGGRNPENDITVGHAQQTLYRTLSGAESYIDLESGEYRKALSSDVRDWAVLVDALENLDAATVPYYSGPMVNMTARDVHGLEILWENTRKHTTTGPYGPKNVRYLVELMTVERGSLSEAKKRPRFSAHISPVPPLQYHENSVEMIMMCGEYGIPVILIPMPMRGVSAPVTLSGTVLCAMAEMLAGVVISQVAHPGSPIIYAGRPTDFDLKRASPLMGSIEVAMIWASCVQVAKQGFMMITDAEGPTSDSPLSDGQSLVEIAFTAILPALAGTDILTGAGGFETTISLDPVLLVIADELHGMLNRLKRGMDASDEALGLDAIRRVGTGSGRNYLMDGHTIKYLRTESYIPSLFYRSARKAWQAHSRKDLYQRARDRAISLLKEHRVPPLEDSVVKEMRKIAIAAENDITEMTTA